MEQPIKVAITGASGKMAREVLGTLCRDPQMEPVGAYSRKAVEEYLSLPDGSGLIPLSADLNSLLTRTRPQVLVDFTHAEGTLSVVRTAVAHNVNLVIGTTGLSEGDLKEIGSLCDVHGVSALVAPNFALGAVLLMQLAKVAAPFFDYAEIIEMHHEAKADAPSGTALATAQEMGKARQQPFIHAPTLHQTLPGTRGGERNGIAIHSIRLPGLVAHQEVIFGSQGQTLTLRHDSTSRESFMPGVIMAIKAIVKLKGLVVGLEKLLGF